jgi:CDP-paratose 2-epimerase
MPKILVTGGCGFIGVHACQRFLAEGSQVLAVDDLSRPGSERNLAILESESGFEFVKADVSARAPVESAFADFQPDAVVHLAAQVAVTTSVVDPRADFEANALGTLNVLEAARALPGKPLVIYASTNKVYGSLSGLTVSEDALRYSWPDNASGVDESQQLDFYSPYGCSKGSADQYCRDYSRIYGLPTVVLRQSCIYGPRQSGHEDQGWVAWFALASLGNQPVTIFGDGKQVRDLLYVEDLTDLYWRLLSDHRQAAGRIFNVGGGPGNSLSLLEYVDYLAKSGLELDLTFSDPRPGDQLIFISDNSLAEDTIGWKPSTPIEVGLPEMIGSLER